MKGSSIKLQIYKGIIQYLLESTHYTLKNIAELSNSSIEHIRLIHCQNEFPADFSSESQLVKLYLLISIPEGPFRQHLKGTAL